MKGLRGRPRSYSSWTRELKGLPEGSLPTRLQRASPSRERVSARVKTLEMLWMEKVSCSSPVPHTSPSRVARARPKREGSAWASSGM
jgi:hypothetical protein